MTPVAVVARYSKRDGRNLSPVKLARSLERRLEQLFEGPARRMFSGRVHPSELAEGIAREADLARFQHATGPATANSYALTLNPRDLAGDRRKLARQLSGVLADYAAEQGLRLEGPPQVTIATDGATPPGQFRCTHENRTGRQEPWCRLIGATEHDIGHNRAVVGRDEECDVRISEDEISRRHALIFREHGAAYVSDLGSTNGTHVDNVRIGSEPIPLEPGSLLILASHQFRFVTT